MLLRDVCLAPGLLSSNRSSGGGGGDGDGGDGGDGDGGGGGSQVASSVASPAPQCINQ